ncbi:MAG: hypothetical protein CVV51_10875 [Spirochaetae bacterium HGW-Spirochaetae-7]|jgi:hypothetical protein|nr:MAG: hypothetical protein CVV51_10875 [Spirochaetae bacterium HGW-Spirochaetae-7]
MSVFVSIEDLEGEPLIEVFELESIHRKFGKVAGCCLRFAGETADASFNALQGPELVSELESLSALELDAVERKELDRLIAVCRKHAGKKNEYVRFYGEAKSVE